MSGRLVGEVADHAPADLTVAQRFVLVMLAEDARERDRVAKRNSSVAALCRRTGLASQTVKNALTELTRRGLIRRRVETVHKGGQHQEYVLAKLSAHHRFTTVTDTPERSA